MVLGRALEYRADRPAVHVLGDLDAGIVEERRRQIHQADQCFASMTPTLAGPGDVERNVGRRMERLRLAPSSVVAELLAVVARIDDDGVLELAALLERVEVDPRPTVDVLY